MRGVARPPLRCLTRGRAPYLFLHNPTVERLGDISRAGYRLVRVTDGVKHSWQKTYVWKLVG